MGIRAEASRGEPKGAEGYGETEQTRWRPAPADKLDSLYGSVGLGRFMTSNNMLEVSG